MTGGGTVEAVARRHGVRLGTLRWWRTMLRREEKSTAPRFVPVVVTAAPVASAGHVDVAIRGVRRRIATGTDVTYAAALVCAIEPW